VNSNSIPLKQLTTNDERVSIVTATINALFGALAALDMAGNNLRPIQYELRQLDLSSPENQYLIPLKIKVDAVIEVIMNAEAGIHGRGSSTMEAGAVPRLSDVVLSVTNHRPTS